MDKYECDITADMMELVEYMESLVIKHREWLEKHPEIARKYDDTNIILDGCKSG